MTREIFVNCYFCRKRIKNKKDIICANSDNSIILRGCSDILVKSSSRHYCNDSCFNKQFKNDIEVLALSKNRSFTDRCHLISAIKQKDVSDKMLSYLIKDKNDSVRKAAILMKGAG